MTTKLPSSCFYAVHGCRIPHNGPLHTARPRLAFLCRNHRSSLTPTLKRNASFKAGYAPDSAFTAIESRNIRDPINPPRSTLPPPLELPTRNEGENIAIFYLRYGKAYGAFYKNGVKAVWYNYKAARVLASRLKATLEYEHAMNQKSGLSAVNYKAAVENNTITRSEFQLLQRNSHDIGKLPFFSVLVLIFGEWLPLIVPFIPSAVPGTCRIPKQVQGMRTKAEEQRRFSFRQGVLPPGKEQVASPTADDRALAIRGEGMREKLKTLRADQLLHLSSTLGLHSRIWDRVQLAPPGTLLRGAILRRLQYLNVDDTLLRRDGGTTKLEQEELIISCHERGLDTMGMEGDQLRAIFDRWLKATARGSSDGADAALAMLFKRPNVWDDVSVPKRR